MWETLKNAWRIKDIRTKLLYTFGMLLLFRLVGVIPAPGVNPEAVQSALSFVGEHALLDALVALHVKLERLDAQDAPKLVPVAQGKVSPGLVEVGFEPACTKQGTARKHDRERLDHEVLRRIKVMDVAIEVKRERVAMALHEHAKGSVIAPHAALKELLVGLSHARHLPRRQVWLTPWYRLLLRRQ